MRSLPLYFYNETTATVVELCLKLKIKKTIPASGFEKLSSVTLVSNT
jgi:hypothetical protein